MLRAIVVALVLLEANGPAGNVAVMRGLQLQYPSTLTLQPPGSRDDALVLTNFHGKYGHGGIIPANGVEITILLEDKKGKTLDQIVQEDAIDSKVISTLSTRINGRPATRIVCEDDFQVFKLAEIRVYVEKDPQIYKFIFTTYPDTANRKAFEASFEGILRTVKFMK